MAIQFVTYDDSKMDSGKFYVVQVNKDNASALVEVHGGFSKLNFFNKRYIEVEYFSDEPPLVQVWETIHHEGGVKKCNMVTLDVSLREDSDKKVIILESSRYFTGFVILK